MIAQPTGGQDLESQARAVYLPNHLGHPKWVGSEERIPGLDRDHRRHLFQFRGRPGEVVEASHEQIVSPSFVGNLLDAVGIVGGDAHNIYLMILIEFGIVGLFIFTYLVWSLVSYIRRQLFDDSELKFSVLIAAYIVLGAWLFSTLIGVLQLISIVWSLAFATLIMSRRDVGVGRNNLHLENGVCYGK